MESRARVPRHRRALFVALTLLLSLGLLEASARALEWLHPPGFVEIDNPVPVFELDRSGERYQRTRYHPLILPDQSFEAVKSDRTFRVFLLGGSAAAGWPHDKSGYSISDQLARKLALLLPDRTIEVINTAGGTYASHRVKFVFDEVIGYEPDLVLIYSGNNEFLENFVFRSGSLPPPWNHFALARVLFRSIESLWNPEPSFDVENYSLADQRVNRLSYAFGRASRYRRDPEQYERVVAHYRFNIEWMVRESLRRGIPAVLLTVPVNLKDWIPNVSVHREGLEDGPLASWQQLYREAVIAAENGEWERTAEALEQALAIDDEHAESHYWLGRAYLKLGRPGEARASFVKALERDAYPFRALPAFQAVLEEIAERYSLPLVDVVGLLEAQTADGLIGLDVLVDYVHLSARSQELVAHELLLEIERAGLLPEPLAVPIEATRSRVPDAFGPWWSLRSILGLFTQNLIMRQYDQLEPTRDRLAELARREATVNPEFAAYCRHRVQGLDNVLDVVRPWQRVLRAVKLGVLEQEFDEAEAQRIYARYTRMIRTLEAPDMPKEEFSGFVPTLDYDGAGLRAD